MTKQDEIKLLAKVIGQFGRDSYIGPWLADNRFQIEADIKSDICINVKMPNAARLEAESILTEAREQAGKLIADANAAALALISGAKNRVDDINGQAREALHRLAGRI
jgi:cell division septum initiation protein DivIVA